MRVDQQYLVYPLSSLAYRLLSETSLLLLSRILLSRSFSQKQLSVGGLFVLTIKPATENCGLKTKTFMHNCLTLGQTKSRSAF